MKSTEKSIKNFKMCFKLIMVIIALFSNGFAEFSFAQTAISKHRDGVLQYKNRNYSVAIDLYNQALNLNPQMLEALNDRGICKKELGDLKGAMIDYNKAISLNSGYASSYVNRGNLFSLQKEYNSALIDFNKAININPKLDTAYNGRGATQEKLGQFSKAEFDYTAAIEINPRNPLYFTNRANVRISLKKYQDALNDCNKAISMNPNDSEFFITRGNVYTELTKYTNAEEDFTKAFILNPKSILAVYNRALIRFKYLGNDTGAIEDCNVVLRINPNDGAALNIRGLSKWYSISKSDGCLDLKKSMDLGFIHGKENYLKNCR